MRKKEEQEMRYMKHEALERLNWRLGVMVNILFGTAGVLGFSLVMTANHVFLVLGEVFTILGIAAFLFWWGVNHADKAIASAEQPNLSMGERVVCEAREAQEE